MAPDAFFAVCLSQPALCLARDEQITTEKTKKTTVFPFQKRCCFIPAWAPPSLFFPTLFLIPVIVPALPFHVPVTHSCRCYRATRVEFGPPNVSCFAPISCLKAPPHISPGSDPLSLAHFPSFEVLIPLRQVCWLMKAQP